MPCNGSQLLYQQVGVTLETRDYLCVPSPRQKPGKEACRIDFESSGLCGVATQLLTPIDPNPNYWWKFRGSAGVAPPLMQCPQRWGWAPGHLVLSTLGQHNPFPRKLRKIIPWKYPVQSRGQHGLVWFAAARRANSNGLAQHQTTLIKLSLS